MHMLQNYLLSFRNNLRVLTTHPATFFAQIEEAEDYRDTLAFMLLLVIAAWGMMWATHDSRILRVTAPGLALFSFVFVGMWGFYLHFAVKWFTRGSLTQPMALRIGAIGSTPLLLTWVPYLGVLAWFWPVWLNWHALRVRAGLGVEAASTMMGIPLAMLFSALAALAMMMALLGIDIFYFLSHDGEMQPVREGPQIS